MWCTGDHEMTSHSAQGDSGGPVFIKDINGQFTQVVQELLFNILMIYCGALPSPRWFDSKYIYCRVPIPICILICISPQLQYGLVSWGVDLEEVGPHDYDVNTAVPHYKPWIDTTLVSRKCCIFTLFI